MRVVLFGAGASHGSGGVSPFRPPLGRGSELIRMLRSGFKGWKGLSEEESLLFERNFEEGMNAWAQDHKKDCFPLLRELACFFDQFVISEPRSCLYWRFLSQLARLGHQGDTVLSTLNYDCLIERACVGLFDKVHLFRIPKDKTEKAIVLLKLHGSCTFTLADGIFEVSALSQVVGFKVLGPVRVIDPGAVCAYYLGGWKRTALPPAMCLYAKGKPSPIGQNVLGEVQELWAELVRSAESAIVIGVSPNRDDLHVWGPLATMKGTLYYVGDEVGFKEWSESERSTRPSVFLGRYWSDCEGVVLDRALGPTKVR